MKFGLFAGGAVPRPWDEGKEALVLQRELEKGIAADRAGFDAYWAPEHHFLEEYCHMSSSDLMVLAVGMRTERIRLTTGIFNLCPPINHPIRVAERIALIDVLTNGRVELGTGRGSGSWEVNGFGVETSESRAMWDEAVHAIPKMWQTEAFSWDGKYFSVPQRNVLPKPVQHPHPPLWVTAGNPETAQVAGERGLGVAFFSFGAPVALEGPIATYRSAIETCEPVGAFVTNQTMTITQLFCSEDREEAFRIYAENAGAYGALFTRYFDTLQQRGGVTERSDMHRKLLVSSREDRIAAGLCVGDPDDVAETVKTYEALGIDQLVFVPTSGFAKPFPFEKTLKSIELVGKHVIPRFRGAATPAGRA